ncbi:flagellar hook-length control protein FliK [Oceanisphaera arctica]|uniref:Flagellar hook-length control protein-like C-terminal domain-containing protein n=1 Tax=Oceanisphaera arctica TaxID=641510 RepID=A0A2P5TMR6_9GAMM|nr:flagellar hook-length control protein FliK [Oceanisphaera arctica]PPL16750.1 hypothetical protein UN63_07435 [Oceanisphaera arctica]GHA06104.1 hypothetical protein GCM10007082_03870 [Oceanisphaera arctica]
MEICALINTGTSAMPTPAKSRQAAPEKAFSHQLARHEKPTAHKAEGSRPGLKKPEPEPPETVSDPVLAASQLPPQDNGLLLAMALPGGFSPAPVPVPTTATPEAAPEITGLPPALVDIHQRLALIDQAGRQTSIPVEPWPPTEGGKPTLFAFAPLTGAGPEATMQAGNPLPEPETTAQAGDLLPGPETIMNTVQGIAPGIADRGLLPANGTQLSPAPGMVSLAAPVASQAWQQQLGQQLIGLALRSDQSMELHLNPAELGPLLVSLKLTEQDAQVQFLSAHGPVRQAVEQAIPQLREALAEQGISLGETSVGEQGQSFAREQPSPPPMTTEPQSEENLEQAVEHSQAIRPVLLDGRVDLYA